MAPDSETSRLARLEVLLDEFKRNCDRDHAEIKRDMARDHAGLGQRIDSLRDGIAEEREKVEEERKSERDLRGRTTVAVITGSCAVMATVVPALLVILTSR